MSKLNELFEQLRQTKKEKVMEEIKIPTFYNGRYLFRAIDVAKNEVSLHEDYRNLIENFEEAVATKDEEKINLLNKKLHLLVNKNPQIYFLFYQNLLYRYDIHENMLLNRVNYALVNNHNQIIWHQANVVDSEKEDYETCYEKATEYCQADSDKKAILAFFYCNQKDIYQKYFKEFSKLNKNECHEMLKLIVEVPIVKDKYGETEMKKLYLSDLVTDNERLEIVRNYNKVYCFIQTFLLCQENQVNYGKESGLNLPNELLQLLENENSYNWFMEENKNLFPQLLLDLSLN